MRALIVEDNPDEARLIEEVFRQEDSPDRFEVESVNRLSAAVERLAGGGIDVVLLDLGLPDSQGAETFARVREAAREVPLLVLSGLADDALALKTIRDGAQDYVVKGHIDGHTLAREVRFAVERKRIEAALREKSEQLKLLLDSTTEAICGVDLLGRCTFFNAAAAKTLGYTGEDSLAGKDMHALVHHTRADGTLYPKELCPIHSSLGRGERLQADGEVFWRADGTSFPVKFRSNPIFRDGMVIGGVVTFEDLTERNQAEALREERRRLATFSTSLGTAITRGGPMRAVLNRCTDEMVQHLDAAFARIWTLNSDENTLELQASSGMYTHINGPHGKVPVGKYKIGRIAAEKKAHLTNDVLNDSYIGDPEWARREGMVSFAGHPLVVEGELVGVLAMFARRQLSEFTHRALGSAADSVSLFIKRKKADHSLEQAEERFRQSQKMEALGRLAGGVAHDFNNVLTAILGYGELAMKSAPPQSELENQLQEIHKAAQRAAGLTRQLLAFGRRQVVQPRVLNVNEVVRNLESMLHRIIDESIHLETSLDQEIGHVRADPGQIEQILMNLTVNSRDAMPNGGTLTIGTANADLDEPYAGLHPGVLPGSYVMVSVSDTGMGMSPETLTRVFEPFFTTKEQGKGTGL
ncbi:MAG TPA: response regulator, partial [Candidatus Limnocylindrales bacterium]|nr:response regulator [Candidatus Limnocylindrales bacterium]